jgi:hypothetical protein
MKNIRFSSVAIALVLGAMAGSGATLLAINTVEPRQSIEAKDRQIVALTVAVTQLQQQLTADAAVRAEGEKRMKAFNRVPTAIAPPQTFQGGFPQ